MPYEAYCMVSDQCSLTPLRVSLTAHFPCCLPPMRGVVIAGRRHNNIKWTTNEQSVSTEGENKSTDGVRSWRNKGKSRSRQANPRDRPCRSLWYPLLRYHQRSSQMTTSHRAHQEALC